VSPAISGSSSIRRRAAFFYATFDHHDKAYDWASKRKLETHPTTGAAQLVEIRETVQEIVIPTYVEAPVPVVTPARSRQVQPQLPLFTDVADDDLLRYGVPVDWVGDVRLATEDTLLALAAHLPVEAAEALLQLATGGTPRIPEPVAPETSPFDHPDAQRRFRVMNNVEELEQALEYPWDKWTIFLHPDQRQWVERNQNGPARVSGTAGTGKTVVALHRAAFLARRNPRCPRSSWPPSRISSRTTFSPASSALFTTSPSFAERIDVYAVNAVGARLYKGQFGSPKVAMPENLSQLIRDGRRRS